MQPQQDNRTKAITFTILLHVALAATLILGIEFSDYRPLSGPKVEIIEAEIVTTPSKPRVDPEVERRKQELEEQQQQEETQAQRRQEIEEKERQQQAVEQRKQAEATKQRKAEAEAKRMAEQKTEQEVKTKSELAARKKAEETARKKKIEEQAKRKTEAEQQAREKALQEALAQEQRERELNPLQDAYRAAIVQKITRNWLQPPNVSTDLRCMVRVTQIPDGSVTSATITKSSGNTVFDESVIKAIYKASPLPEPPSPEVFDRDVDVAFCSTGEAC